MSRLTRSPRGRRLPALDRRALLSAGLGLTLAVSMAACGADASTPGGAGGGAGVVKWAWQLPTTWDPVTSSAGSDVQMLALTYSSLTHIDEQGNAIPHLAEKWEYNADGTQVTFTLQDGLTFSDGAPIDADAVKVNLERGRDADNSLIAPQLADLVDVSVDDELTFTLTLDGPNYQYPNLLAGKTGMLVNPKVIADDVESLATKPAGSGPFTLDSYTQNANAKLTRNPKYFQADEILVANFELYPAADAATVVASVQSGQYNVGLLPGSQVQAAEAAGLDVQEIPSLYVATLDVNVTKKPFDDPAVVEALHYAVDRQELVDAGQFGVGEVNYQPFPPGHVGYNEELKDVFAYDPDKAKGILKDAGYTEPIPLTISASNPEGVPELLQSQLEEVGFAPEIEAIPIAQFTQQVYINHSEALAVDGFAGRESPAQAFQVLFSDTGLMNPGRQYDPAVRAAIERVIATPLDDPKYAELLQAAVKVAVETMPNTFLYTVPRVLVRNTSVSAVPESPALVEWNGVSVQ
ncbi:ABC transporter substrate-binding protein [Nocardioides sp. cx-173]|uniref:ABC transporter substrate-binding protein n=1 Tax=Nocardioides sp. cx-173 TaxID=2898796 RepID=UPI001E4D5431|nr:ABC transporter substrate-binding protein [Nocardioides sp. cx-173]MCD4526868.1 ABC transporter substrate-binding protein [Nocardioides sp. cx-173]UGB41343.1 ABC transporter substrate-binding protein [Nocardioides sp. cx-173]